MSGVVGGQPPASVRIVGLLGLLWNLIGVYFYLGRVGMIGDGAGAAAMGGGETWMTAVFAISVFGGTIGCIGLLMLKSWSRLLLVLSLLAVLAQDYAVLKAGVNGSAIVMPALVTAIAVLLAWVAHAGVKRGWLS